MGWLNSLREGIWGVLGALAGAALLAVIVVPLGEWFWGWLSTGSNAMAVIALALIGAGAGFAWAHVHKAENKVENKS